MQVVFHVQVHWLIVSIKYVILDIIIIQLILHVLLHVLTIYTPKIVLQDAQHVPQVVTSVLPIPYPHAQNAKYRTQPNITW